MAIISPEAEAAYQETIGIIETIPDEALNWVPQEGEWSCKQVIRHIAGVGGFYQYILDRVRATGFGLVVLDRAEIGQRIAATEAAFQQVQTTAEALALFNAAHQQGLGIIGTITPDELDRSFQIQSFRPGAEPEATTLRKRIVEGMGAHLRDHEGQLRDTLAAWRAN